MTTDPTKILGASGLKRSGGWITEEWHKRLRGSKGARAYREMRDNDPIVGAIRFCIDNLVTQAEWSIEPAGDVPGSAEVDAAEFVEGCLTDMDHTLDDMLLEALTMLDFGWAYLEEVYKARRGDESRFDDGRWGWASFGLRSQDSLEQWEFDAAGKLVGMWQYTTEKGRVLIPVDKALHFVTRGDRGNPEGRSMYRNAYVSYYYASNLRSIEGIGMERDLAGLPVMYVPAEIMDPAATGPALAARTALEKLVQDIRRDEREGMLLPSVFDDAGNQLYKLELLSTGGKRALDISAAIERYEKRMAMSMLAEFLFLGMDQVGSFALASEKTAMFALAVGGIMDRIAGQFNRTSIPRLMRLNGFPQAVWPTLVHGDIERRAVEEAVKTISDAVGVGILTADDSIEAFVRSELGLPPLSPDQIAGPGTRAQDPAGSAQAAALAAAQAAAESGE